LVMGPFQKRALASHFDPLVRLAEQQTREWQPGQVRDVFQDMTRYMLRVTSSLLFGFDVPQLSYEIGRLIERLVSMNHQVGMAGFVPDQAATSSYVDLLELAAALEDKTRAMIAYRRSRPPGADLLSGLLQAQDDDGAALTDDELIGQTTLLFGA